MAVGARENKMKVICYQEKNGSIGYAAQRAGGSALEMTGDIYNSPQVSQQKADVAKLLARVMPSSIVGTLTHSVESENI